MHYNFQIWIGIIGCFKVRVFVTLHGFFYDFIASMTLLLDQPLVKLTLLSKKYIFYTSAISKIVIEKVDVLICNNNYTLLFL